MQSYEKLARMCFNKTWEYIEKQDRTPEEDLNMIHCAHTSRYLWDLVGEPFHFQRGEWLISKVYYQVGSGERALVHAKACYDICVQNKIGDFNITLAYESLANAYKLLGDQANCDHYRKAATDSLDGISEKEDRDYVASELEKI
jgi:hypothetical protein